MANPVAVKTFRTSLSKDFTTLVAAIRTWIGSRRFEILDISVTRRTLRQRNRDLIVRILYKEFASATTRFVGRFYTVNSFRYTAGDTQPPENAISAYYGIPANIVQGGDGFQVPRWVIDCSEKATGAGQGQEYIVIAEKFGGVSPTTTSYGLGRTNSAFIVQAVGAIAPRATGDVVICIGPSVRITGLAVRNLSYTNTWEASAYGWVVLDDVEGYLVGVPGSIVAQPAPLVRSFFGLAYPRLGGAAVQADVPKMEYAGFALPYSPKP